MNDRLFSNRRDAGRVLAGLLRHYRGLPDVVVLGLPRGGVPVAYEVATALGHSLDIFLVRKLGTPGHEELAMGAISSGGVVVLNEDVVRALDITPETMRQVVQSEARELARRELAYRGDLPTPELRGKIVIMVDDGLATGASMRAAIRAVRRREPAQIVVAVPAAPESTCRELSTLVDEVICATTPTPFFSVGESYWHFTQTTDEEVRQLLHAASSARVWAPPARTDLAVLRSELVPTEEGVPVDDVLFDIVGDARFVLIGEASHGTHEFYAARARMTRRLIEEKGFTAVAVEADWPDAYRVNRFVRGRGDDATAEEALRGFQRFPAWMWRNADVLEFVGWLRERNDRLDERARAGFYGIDLYSLHRSAAEVVAYLEKVDPAAAERARERYSCLDHSDGDDGQAYGFAAAFGAGESCEQHVIDQLVDLQRNALRYQRAQGLLGEDEFFYAELNAKVVATAERYYRTMFGGRVSSWNLRDRHMADTLFALAEHLGWQRSEPAKIVVWAHNSHLGDARATEMGTRGELNLGQLVREHNPEDCRLIGFTTYSGTVTAADDWGRPAERKNVRPALPDSVEELFKEVGHKEFLLDFVHSARAAVLMRRALLERAIGVIYRPDTERQSHYFQTRVSDQFDAVIHIDETRAVEPLERTALWERGEAPETYPVAV
ncbi:erythromycin esterase family protein [Planotetraspora sp. A-T 1434]|uniref:erythromycin esterase family protein n=1 Tax=Planotetraspora sp. A-T 1434 TaxID=2979219 RepID=UPI0021C0BF80|nr:erythromycin esterase family protein [Planotetraspora sp. A-T 1434]MCT9933922.1 erythromycin esterase family protein [Planotetraspora sp. A-T 1434]